MKLITRDIDYALRALCFIAKRKKKIISVTELVTRLGIPQPFLRKILQTLNKEKILKSHKGQGGGFELAVLPEKIFLLKLMAIFQGPIRLNECLFKKSPCPNVKGCILKRKIDRIQRFVGSELRNVTLASLLGSKNG